MRKVAINFTFLSSNYLRGHEGLKRANSKPGIGGDEAGGFQVGVQPGQFSDLVRPRT